jgi:type IV fimbrial biogenesis protein FimT
MNARRLQHDQNDFAIAEAAPWRVAGFTLIELMVTLSVLGVLLALVSPSFTRLIATNRLASQTNEFVATLHLARSEAVRRAQSVTLRATANPDDYSKGWRVFLDADADGSPAEPSTKTDGEALRVIGPSSGGITIKRATRSGTPGSFSYSDAPTSVTDRMYLTFSSRGAAQSAGSTFFRICDASHPDVGGRIVQINLVGKISLDSTTANCS